MPDMPDLPGLESPIWGPMPPKIGIKAQDTEEGKGVNVLDVTDGSAAEKAGLKKGDVITRFDGNEVNSANELIQQVRGSREKSSVKVDFCGMESPGKSKLRFPGNSGRPNSDLKEAGISDPSGKDFRENLPAFFYLRAGNQLVHAKRKEQNIRSLRFCFAKKVEQHLSDE